MKRVGNTGGKVLDQGNVMRFISAFETSHSFTKTALRGKEPHPSRGAPVFIEQCGSRRSRR